MPRSKFSRVVWHPAVAGVLFALGAFALLWLLGLAEVGTR